MTIIEFLKMHVSEETPIGDLARDIMNDKDFPIERSEEGIISYLEFKTRRNHKELFDDMMIRYKQQRHNAVDSLNLGVNFNLFRTEQWLFLKNNFSSDKAILVGDDGEVYRLYAIDSLRKKALRFDFITKRNLNDLVIVQLDKIHRGALNREVSIPDALEMIGNNKPNDMFKPTEPNFAEMIEYLKSQVVHKDQ